MIWPPLKAWTSKINIDGQVHFVAINYGGELLDRWVLMMSVIDSSLVVNVSWSELVHSSNWECGWKENQYLESGNLASSKRKKIPGKCILPSSDSGLTIPITEGLIRPWGIYS